MIAACVIIAWVGVNSARGLTLLQQRTPIMRVIEPFAERED